jgi:integrase
MLTDVPIDAAFRNEGLLAAGKELPSTSRVTLAALVAVYLEDYELRQFSTLNTARGRVVHLLAFFGEDCSAQTLTSSRLRQYQMARRRDGAAAATVNRETSALSRMYRLCVQLGWLTDMPVFPARLHENGPRQGFFEHGDYLTVRSHLPAPYQDVLDFAYYSGWRKHEILGLRWDEIDAEARVIRLPPHRSKTRTGRVLPISEPLKQVLERRRARPRGVLVFGRDDVTVRAWRRAWPEACVAAGVPGRLLHDCRRTTARNLVRAGIPERVAMTLTGHKTRSVFDRYNIVNERELAEAGDRLCAYLQHKQ